MSIRLTKLPSDILPQLDGVEFTIAETKSGKLFWVDSDGAKELATKEDFAAITEEVQKDKEALDSLKQMYEEATQQLLEAKAKYEQAAEATKTRIL